jgi:ABC-2 type transport system ATP-binding protein
MEREDGMTTEPRGGVPDVELVGAHKHFGSVHALDGIDLRIERGESVAILGPNGAGKTTAISLMLGIRAPTAGRVRLFGLDPASRAARSGRGAMLQDSGIPASLTVRELVDLFRSYYPAPIATDRALELAGLEGEARRRAGALSGGQRQRLYFALAVCGDPPVLFLDEPTVAMDVASRIAFLDTISGYASSGRTVVLTTHFMDEADQVARRIVVIDHGHVIADASPAEIKGRAAGRRVRFRTTDTAIGGLLADLPIRGLTRLDGEVRFLADEPEPILAELFRRGAVIHDLEVGGADLEDAFLALTGGGPDADVAPGPSPDVAAAAADSDGRAAA